MEKMMEQPQQNRKMHPQKFALYIAMGSIVMMFAGLTSAYIVRQAQGNWVYFRLPMTFTVSTVAIVLSSVTMHLSLKAFKQRLIPRYRVLITITLLLGILFCALQWIGFQQLTASQEQRIRRLLASFRIIGLNETVKEETIRLRKDFRLKLPDCIVAATALSLDLPLLTADKQFRVIPSLMLEIYEPS